MAAEHKSTPATSSLALFPLVGPPGLGVWYFLQRLLLTPPSVGICVSRSQCHPVGECSVCLLRQENRVGGGGGKQIMAVGIGHMWGKYALSKVLED